MSSYVCTCVHCTQIDCLVNNGGRSQRGEVVNTSLEVDKAVLSLNTIGTISMTKAVLPQMRKQSKGLIVIVSSLAGKMGRFMMHRGCWENC